MSKLNSVNESTRPRLAVVTGASSGLGAELARLLDGEERIDEIWLIARRKERLESLAGELHKPCRVLAGDLTEAAFLQSLREALAARGAAVDTLVNSAGFGKLGPVAELGEEQNAAMTELNCLALTRLCSICLPLMREGGRILNIASVAAFMPQPNFAVYAATKAYVLSYSRALNAELKPRKITVTAVCPNPMETEFFGRAGMPEKVSPIKKIGVEPVEKVARHALARADRGKDISLYCLPARLIRLVSRLFPHPFVLWIEKKIGLY